MPITLLKTDPMRLGRVEAMLESAKATFLKERIRGLEMAAWVFMVRAGILMDNEPMQNANAAALFPTCAKFCGEPETNATYDTAKRALAGDYNRIMGEIRALELTDKEKRQFVQIAGEPGAL